ncbi:MAG: hypothetical protein JXR50_10525 [Prolixibacteraceae bacterium]|nr:hypothetical protein [Prolixibacteraceae bacterium]MBN2650161.1 hypothetical protein [Prolixibacteraceae bacterium]
MKTKIKILFIVLSILFSFIACDKAENNTPIEKDKNISYLKSSLGGCNNKTEENIEQGEEKNDTTIIQIKQDTLSIYAGLNYICCAPFITDCNITNDSIFVSITDTCSNPYQDCYCRCYCYYTFEYYFNNLSDKQYYWRITLIDPREENEILFDEGVIDKRI